MENKTNLVWYVSYGSNMLTARFLHYLMGGSFNGLGRNIPACRDTAPPRSKMNYEIPYNMYFAKRSANWNNGGISFLDITAPGKAYGVAYLITREQFEHVYQEENGGSRFGGGLYGTIVNLGIFDDIPVVTITNSQIFEKSNASEEYLNTLYKGLKENYIYKSNEEIKKYLFSRNE